MRRAFTLIEVLVVLAITGIVMSIGVAAVGKLREQATTRTLSARIKQINIAKQQFIAEWGRIEAELTWSDPNRDGNTTDATDQGRYELLKRYIQQPPFNITDFAPRDCTIVTPSSIYNSYSGTDTTGATITDTN